MQSCPSSTQPPIQKAYTNSREQVVSLPLQLWMPVEARLQEQRDRHDVHVPKVRLQPESSPNQKDQKTQASLCFYKVLRTGFSEKTNELVLAINVLYPSKHRIKFSI